jgi:hypothetical protein
VLLAPRAQRSGPFEEKERKEGEEGGATGTAISISSPLLLLSSCFAHRPRRKRKKRARKVITEQARGRKQGNGRLRVVSSV